MRTILVPEVTCPDAVRAKELAHAVTVAGDLEAAIRAKLAHKHLTGWSYTKARTYPGNWSYEVDGKITVNILDLTADDI